MAAISTRGRAQAAGSTTVRVARQTHDTLLELARETGAPIQDIVADAVEAYRRARMFEVANAAYAALRSNPEAWRELLEERAEWDVTLADGHVDE